MIRKLTSLFITAAVGFTAYAQSVIQPGPGPWTAPPFNTYTVVGWFAGNPPVIDGKLDDAIWTTAYDATPSSGLSTFGAGFNSTTGQFPSGQRFTKQINTNDNGVVAPTAPAGAPSSGLYNTTPTFGIAWDTTNFYFAIVVLDPNFNADQPSIAGTPGVELFFGMDPGSVSKKPSAAAVWPPVLNAGWEGQLVLNYKGTSNANNPLTNANGGIGSGQGMSFQSTDVTVFTSPCTFSGQSGYIMEGSIKWSKLNSQWISPATGAYTDATKKPNYFRTFLLDLSNNINAGAPLARVAQLMWNQCCHNNNYQEAQYYGTAVLSGLPQVVCPTSLAVASNSGVITTEGGELNLSPLTPTPPTATSQVRWSIINPSPENGLTALINSAGKVTALKNGVVTAVGTSTCDTTIKVTQVVNITGQATPTALSVSTTFTGTEFRDMWGFVPFTAAVTGTGGTPAQNVVWYVDSPEGGLELATINSVTGVLRSTSVGAGVVTVTAVSVADNTVLNTKLLTINPYTTIQSCNWIISSFANDAKCRSFDRTTFAGYSAGITVNTIYELPDSGKVKLQIIPSDLMKYTVRQNLTFVSPSVSSNGDLILANAQATGTITITGQYINNPEIQRSVVVRLNSAASSLVGSTTGCNNPIADNRTCAGIASTCTGAGCTLGGVATGSSVDDVLVFPNPTSGAFTVQLYSNAGGPVLISVLNTTGTLVYSTSANLTAGEATDVQVSTSLPSGMYFVRITSESGSPVVKRLLVK